MREASMSLLFWSASAMASLRESAACSDMSTPTRPAEGRGLGGASKFGATGGGSVGSSAGATPPEVPTVWPGPCGTPAGLVVCAPPGLVPVCGEAVPAGVEVCGVAPAGGCCPGVCGEGGRGPCVLGVVCCRSCSGPVCGCVLCCVSLSGRMGADEELGGSCVVGVGAAPGFCCCVRFCASTAQG